MWTEDSASTLTHLPLEILRRIAQYLDIASLGSSLSVSPHGPWPRIVLEDPLWAGMVQRRFGLETVKSSTRLQSGSSTWKEAYRSLHRCNRIPKCRYTSATRKVVFAKGGGAKQSKGCALGVWVLVGHTEDCKTRVFNSQRYLELHVCLQNVRTGAGPIDVDHLGIGLDLVGQSALVHPRMASGCKILWSSFGLEADPFPSISLRPFDFCVARLLFPCEETFETDLLARAEALHVPYHAYCGTKSLATALFLSEKDLWNHYTELPGGFLTLNDRFRLHG